MSPRLISTTLLGMVALVLPLPASAATTSESGSPINDQGSNFNYRSNITRVTPSVPGLSLEVLEFADRLLLRNHTGKTVTIYGYQGEPYARVLADGAAEQNTRSPATYLNTSFYGNVTVPASAKPSAPPHWVVVDRTGQFEWHDHRIHWMSPLTPPQVKDKSKRTLIFDWRVPIRVGAQAGVVTGQLFWTPESSHASMVVIVLGVAIALCGLLLVLFVRRRRARADADSSASGPRGGGRPTGQDFATGGGLAGSGGGGDSGAGGGGGGSETPAKEAW
jgi:hypothetical protein